MSRHNCKLQLYISRLRSLRKLHPGINNREMLIVTVVKIQKNNIWIIESRSDSALKVDIFFKHRQPHLASWVFVSIDINQWLKHRISKLKIAVNKYKVQNLTVLQNSLPRCLRVQNIKKYVVYYKGFERTLRKKFYLQFLIFVLPNLAKVSLSKTIKFFEKNTKLLRSTEILGKESQEKIIKQVATELIKCVAINFKLLVQRQMRKRTDINY